MIIKEFILKNLKHSILVLAIVFMGLTISSMSRAEQIIFVINTTEFDNAGPATAAYLDEARWMRPWEELSQHLQNADPSKNIKIVTIRANTNREITKMLELWLEPTPNQKQPREVLVIAIYSHGEQMKIYNEKQSFYLQLPDDLKTVFAPAVGRFAKGARILITGCNVLWGQSPMTALSSLNSIAQALDIKDGLIYANYNEGFDPFTLLADPLNSDIKPAKRLAALATYLIWPYSLVTLPILNKYLRNQGFILELKGQDRQLLKVHQNQIFKIDSQMSDLQR